MKEIIAENMKGAQVKQKEWYDKKARELQIKEGDQVVSLFPTRTEKLLAKSELWDQNSQIEKNFHINMFKKWYKKEESFVNVLTDEQDELSYAHLVQQDVEQAQFGKNLTSEQEQIRQPLKEQIRQLLKEYFDIIGKCQGIVTGVKHWTPTMDQLRTKAKECNYF